MRRAMLWPLLLLLISTPAAGQDYRIAILANESTGTGAIDADGAGPATAAAGVGVHGGWSLVQVTCYLTASCSADDVHGSGDDAATALCCSGSGTGTCGTWPDSVDLEARLSSAHAWVVVDGSTSYTADQREGVFWFAPGESARVSITDAAGSHACTVTLAFVKGRPS